MLYKVVSKIIDKRKTVGYQLTDQDGNLYSLFKEKAGELAANILVINAVYNSKTESLTGREVKLSSLPNVPISSIDAFDDDKVVGFIPKRTNHDLYESYKLKAKLLNGVTLDTCDIGNDRICLRGISNYEYGKLIIPPFISDFGFFDYGGYYGPFDRMIIPEIHIDNRADRGFRAFRMLNNLNSTKIKITFSHPDMVIDLSYLLTNSPLLTDVDIEASEAKNVISMAGMFGKCLSLRSVTLSKLNTTNVINMKGMFSGCINLEEVDMSGLDLSNVVSMEEMFYGCSNLKSVKMSGCDLQSLENTAEMFRGCESLTDVDLGNLGFSKLKTANAMFRGCKSLEKLEINRFNIGQSTDIRSMFYGCSSLRNLDLREFDVTSGSLASALIDCDKSTFLLPDQGV